jgi:acyl dehydratase
VVSRVFDGRETRFGRYYDELDVGDVYLHWPGKTVTEADDHLFCLLTLAASPVHLDAHYAREEMEWGRNIVVGTLVYSLVLGMSVPDISGKAIANLGLEHLRHVRPLFHGDTLYARSTVAAKRPSGSRPGAGIVTVDSVGVNQEDEVVCEFRRSVLLPMKASVSADA